MPTVKKTKKKAAKTGKKVKSKVVIKEKVKVRPKAAKSRDSLPKAPTRTTLPDNAVTFKVKIRRK